MKRTPLVEYLAHRSQTELAEAVGLTQGAISKMKLSERTILVIEHDSGRIELLEEKPIAPLPSSEHAA